MSEEQPSASSGNAEKAEIIVRVDANTFSDNEEGYLGDDCESASDTEDDYDADEDDGQEAEIRNSIDNITAKRQSQIDVDEDDGDWNRTVEPGFPYKNAQTLIIMLCLYNGYSNPFSRSQLKTFLYDINKIVDLAVESAKKDILFNMPTANKILKGDEEGKKYDSPRINLTTSQHEVIVQNEEVTKSCTSILPSEHLTFSMANPREAKHLSAFRDRSINVSNGLATGSKLVRHPDFQHPQITVAGKDFWIGGLAEVLGFSNGTYFLLESFFAKDGRALVDGYIVMQFSGETFGVVDVATEVLQNALLDVRDKIAIAASRCHTLVGSSSSPLIPDHH